MSRVPEGIYYKEGQRPLSSFCILFLDVRHGATSENLAGQINDLWEMFHELKFNSNNNYYGNTLSNLEDMSILVGYSASMFQLPGITKEIPSDFKGVTFDLPILNRGNPILSDSSLRYAKEISENPLSSTYVVVQLIGKTESMTRIGWTKIRELLSGNRGDGSLYIRKFYTGYNRPDGRSWLGFLDGVSNIRSHDRESIISIGERGLNEKDKWTIGGTYLAFIRMNIDLENWTSRGVESQERIVGRDKETGCPIVGVRDGKNVLADGCPFPGTNEIIQYGNERFRDSFSGSLDIRRYDPSVKLVAYSHAQKMIDAASQLDSKGELSRIFRQGYDYLDPINEFPYYNAGLNFVSYQNNPQKVINLLRAGFSQKPNDDPQSVLSEFVTVESAGVFLVPQYSRGQKFPGEILFAT